MNMYTLGFTQKSARDFFGLITSSNVTTLIDVRLNNVSQLAGFAKKNDLQYFLQELTNVAYLHVPDWAPTKEMLKAYRAGDMPWATYEDNFMNLMARRNIERMADSLLTEGACLLCSEHRHHLCHRQLLVEYFNDHMSTALEVKHLY